MRSYKIESYVPEKNFLAGKDAHFCRAAFADCFVIDVRNKMSVIASSRASEPISFSMADAATLLTLGEGEKEFVILPRDAGTLVIYPAWRNLGLALAFLFEENSEEVTKAYQNAQRYAFSAVFDDESEAQKTPKSHLKTKLCVLDFYMNRLFGDNRETNITAQILMIANLMGCNLCEMEVSHVDVPFDEQEVERLSAYLCCAFMTMRKYSGRVSTTGKTDQNPQFFTHVSQKYAIRIQQSIKERMQKPTPFDLLTYADVANFATHPAFAGYRAEETNDAFHMHIPLKHKARFSAFSACGREPEIILTIFPF